MLTLRTIVHPTDFSATSMEAFYHALRIAVTMKSELCILHVSAAGDERDWTTFPLVRRALADWGLMNEHETQAAGCDRLGIKVSKIGLPPQPTLDGILTFLDQHPADLIVLATAARQGVARWLQGSVAEKLARHAKAPALFVPNQARGFVDPLRGEVHLKRVLIPVDREPQPAAAISTIMGFAHALAGIDVQERLLHVGKTPPEVKRHNEPHRAVPVVTRRGDVVDSIIDAASDWKPDLIGMATAGHNGFLDALRGSTTERVLRRVPCPLLAVPAAS